MPDYKPLFNTSGKRIFTADGEPVFAYVRSGYIDVSFTISGSSGVYRYGYGVIASAVSHTFTRRLTRSGGFGSWNGAAGQNYDQFLCLDTAGREWRTYITLGAMSLSYSTSTKRFTLTLGTCTYQDYYSQNSGLMKNAASIAPSYVSDQDITVDTTYTGSNYSQTLSVAEYTNITAPSSLSLSFTET